MTEETREFIQHRLEKLARWRTAGIEPYPTEFPQTNLTAEVVAEFDQLAEAETSVSVAGRIVALRSFGKSTFAHVQDAAGRIQVYFQINKLGEQEYERVGWLDIGDIVGVTGTLFRTRTDEMTISVTAYRLLSKSLEPLPEKWHGLADKELRYRRRYVDLTVNPDVREIFRQRALALRSLRDFLDGRGFLEVETPILQPLYGGATARPFKTHHNALDIPLYLRIADELYLKRLLVGGLDRVYEVCKDFRNEGMDRDHNPEFTMIEYYCAYADYREAMRLTQELVTTVAQAVCGSTTVAHGDGTLDLGGEWPRHPYLELLSERVNRDVAQADVAELAALCEEHGQSPAAGSGRAKLYDLLFKLAVEPSLQSPVFIIDYPRELSPLAKARSDRPELVERFELFVNGSELANGFSELNDPEDQRARFQDQVNLRKGGDDEAHLMDEDYLRALAFGMPPAAGVGLGFDRLVKILTNQHSIRDVILFPQMRPVSPAAAADGADSGGGATDSSPDPV